MLLTLAGDVSIDNVFLSGVLPTTKLYLHAQNWVGIRGRGGVLANERL